MTSIAGCAEKGDPTAKAEKKDAEQPGMLATKDISREAHIYGFPQGLGHW